MNAADALNETDLHSPQPEALFDAAHLAVYTLGDRELEAEVLQLFIDQAQIYRQRLLEANTPQEWREAAHSLKGSARGVGAFALGAFAERLEKMDEAQSPSLKPFDRTALMAALGDDMQAAERAMRLHLQKQA